EPLRGGGPLCKQGAKSRNQAAKSRVGRIVRVDRFKRAMASAVQLVECLRLPVRPVRHIEKCRRRDGLDEGGVATKAIFAAVRKMGIRRQAIPRFQPARRRWNSARRRFGSDNGKTALAQF